MALARLRRVLQGNYRVQLQSDQHLLDRVTAKINERAQRLAEKGQPAPQRKNPTTVAFVQNTPVWQIRAIDLLHKIGRLTTPTWVNMAQLSASWATRRYFWAIADGNGGPQNFRLSEDARLIDFHQKTLMSDEFGIGMAGLLVEQFLNAPAHVDVSIALNDPAVYQDIQQIGEAQPDYLMWGEPPASPYCIVECKGCQTSSATSMDQLRRGLEQVPSIVFGAGQRPTMMLVIATCLEDDLTTVYVLDPPDDPSDARPPDPRHRDEVSERTGKRAWRISNPEKFEHRLRIAKESELLKWAGQFGSALKRDASLVTVQAAPTLPNQELHTRETIIGPYRGCWWPLFPELGQQTLRLFTGVQEELLAMVVEGSQKIPGMARLVQDQVSAQLSTGQVSPYESLSPNGTCMIVDGV